MKRNTSDNNGTPAGDRVAQMMQALLPVHGALTPGWLVDAACTAAERGLNAPYAFLFFEDQDGRLECKQPASDLRRRSHQRALDELGTIVFRTKLDPGQTPLLAEALDGGATVCATPAEFFGEFIGEERAAAGAKALAVERVFIAPLQTAGERLGALMALGAATIEPAHVQLLADHIACASVNLRNSQLSREKGVIDVVRSVFDARKLEAELQRELARASRYERTVSICVIEATNLRLLRERFGRFLTDRLLQRLGESLAQNARDIDILGAYKESGYTMVLTEATAEGAESAAGRLLQTALDTNLDDGDGVPGLELHLAVGWAACPSDGTTSDALFGAAERRMYEAASQVA